MAEATQGISKSKNVGKGAGCGGCRKGPFWLKRGFRGLAEGVGHQPDLLCSRKGRSCRGPDPPWDTLGFSKLSLRSALTSMFQM